MLNTADADEAVQLTGLPGVKNSTAGSLTIENGNLRFHSFQEQL